MNVYISKLHEIIQTIIIIYICLVFTEGKQVTDNNEHSIGNREIVINTWGFTDAARQGNGLISLNHTHNIIVLS